MNWINENWWPLFLGLFLLLLITSLWMAVVAKHFRLSASRVFSIFDLELPPSEKSFILLLQDIYKDAAAAKKLRQHLLIDFLFMPAAYAGIAMLCYKTAMKMTTVGKWIFLFLAAVQIIAWLFDVIENMYLWRKLNKPPDAVPYTNTEKSKGYKSYQFMVKAKFGIAFTGTACSVFGLLYYWIMGDYRATSLPWLAALVGLIAIFFFIANSFKKQLSPDAS